MSSVDMVGTEGMSRGREAGALVVAALVGVGAWLVPFELIGRSGQPASIYDVIVALVVLNGAIAATIGWLAGRWSMVRRRLVATALVVATEFGVLSVAADFGVGLGGPTMEGVGVTLVFWAVGQLPWIAPLVMASGIVGLVVGRRGRPAASQLRAQADGP